MPVRRGRSEGRNLKEEPLDGQLKWSSWLGSMADPSLSGEAGGDCLKLPGGT